jgi:NfeD-like C-terminal, partner-binding
MTGQQWLAVSGGGVTIPADTPVIVTAVEGTTLIVWPLDGPQLEDALGGELESDRPVELPPDGADGRAT